MFSVFKLGILPKFQVFNLLNSFGSWVAGNFRTAQAFTTYAGITIWITVPCPSTLLISKWP